MTEVDAPAAVTEDTAWRRLDARMLAVFPLRQSGALVPLLVVVLVSGRGAGGWQVLGALAAPLALVLVGVVRWLTVRYRVSAERVELRSGLLHRKERSLRRDRVRTVDLHAGPVHRVFGLTVVEVGTGSASSAEGRLSLDAVTAEEAERLRRELLARSSTPAVPPVTAERPSALPPGPSPSAPEATASEAGVTVAQLRPSWLRFAPLTMSGLVAVGAIVGTAFKVAGDAGVDLTDSATVTAAGNRLSMLPLWAGVTVLLVGVLLVAAIGSLLIYLESWWRYRLTRETDGTLRLRRGLVTTRSLSVEQRRIRGATVVQPLALRLAGGARCQALTTGLDAESSGAGALLPPAPLTEAHRVAAAALLVTDPDAATAAPTVRHPPAALRRRLTRALLPTVALVLVAWWLPAELPVWPAALVLVPLAALVGADRYRNLGHAVRPEYLVISSGSLVRRRVALQRRGIIGWRIRQSLTQRWSGLATVDAVTAAGAGGYSVVDVSLARAAWLVEQVNPGLLPIAGDDAGSATTVAEQAPGDLPTQRAGR